MNVELFDEGTWFNLGLAEGYAPHLGEPQGRVIEIDGEIYLAVQGGVSWDAPGEPPHDGCFLGAPLPGECRPSTMRTVSAAADAYILKLDAMADGQLRVIGASPARPATWLSLYGLCYRLT